MLGQLAQELVIQLPDQQLVVLELVREQLRQQQRLVELAVRQQGLKVIIRVLTVLQA